MFLINDLNWFEDLSEFDGGFMRICKKEVMQVFPCKLYSRSRRIIRTS